MSADFSDIGPISDRVVGNQARFTFPSAPKRLASSDGIAVSLFDLENRIGRLRDLHPADCKASIESIVKDLRYMVADILDQDPIRWPQFRAYSAPKDLFENEPKSIQKALELTARIRRYCPWESAGIAKAEEGALWIVAKFSGFLCMDCPENFRMIAMRAVIDRPTPPRWIPLESRGDAYRNKKTR